MPTELWLALDVNDHNTAINWVKELKDHIDVFKIGLGLFTSAGPDIVKRIKEMNCHVFLDLKLHDIPNTVTNAIKNLTRLNVDYIDLHALGGSEMMKSAYEAVNEESEKRNLLYRPKLLAITVLTSLDAKKLKQLSIDSSPDDLVMNWAKLAKECNMDGVVNSVHEISIIKNACGNDFLSITPGIRLEDEHESDDQSRIGTPYNASSLGANAIVVGRPILKSSNPILVAKKIKNSFSS